MKEYNEYITSDIREIAVKSVEKIKNGKLRNHKLGNSAHVHSGEEEEVQLDLFAHFITSKNCAMILKLAGYGDYE